MEIGAARLDESKFIQNQTVTSAADALTVQTNQVPAGKIWTLIALQYYPSAAETRNVLCGRVLRTNAFIASRFPQQISLSAVPWPAGFIDLADPVVLYERERLRVQRDVATAGSTMTIEYAFIETDVPYQKYLDPLRSVTRKPRRSLLGGGGGGGEGGGGGGEGSAGTGFGGGGGALGAVCMSGLVEPLRTIARNLPRVAEQCGFAARVTSGYRSTRKQAELYDRWLRGLQPYPVAPPGTSDHERGLAIDVISTDIAALVRLLASVGLSWAGPADPVHFGLPARKSQARAISQASASWRAGPGASIPSSLSYLPGGLGTVFSVAQDPWAAAKNLGKTLLTAISGGWL